MQALRSNWFSADRTDPHSRYAASCADMCGLEVAQSGDIPSSALLLLCRHEAQFWTGESIWEEACRGDAVPPRPIFLQTWPETQFPLSLGKGHRANHSNKALRARWGLPHTRLSLSRCFIRAAARAFLWGVKVLKLQGLQNIAALTDWGKHAKVLMVMSM